MVKSIFDRHRPYIINQLRLGRTTFEIADALDVNRASLATYCSRNGIPRGGVTLTIPAGVVNVLRSFEVDQLYYMQAKALELGCRDLAEYVVEIVRDALAVEMEGMK